MRDNAPAVAANKKKSAPLRRGEDGAVAAMHEPHLKPIRPMAFGKPEGLELEEDLLR